MDALHQLDHDQAVMKDFLYQLNILQLNAHSQTERH
jgi:hypothetical protein